MPAPRPLLAEDLLCFHTVGDVQVSPSGHLVAFELTTVDVAGDTHRTSIHVMPVAGGSPRALTSGTGRDTCPRWSPDGRQVAFLSHRDGEKPQVHLQSLEGGEARCLTALELGAGPVSWAPDGRRLVFSAPAWKDAPPVDPAARAAWEQRPRVVDDASYRYDGMASPLDVRQGLYLLDLEGERGAVPLTGGDAEDRSPSFSPDGRHVVFSRVQPHPLHYQACHLWLLEVATGAARPLTSRVPRAHAPAWSPDGRLVACYGGDESSRSGYGDPSWRVWLVPVEAGEARNLTGHDDRAVYQPSPPASAPPPVFTPSGDAVLYLAADRGCVHVLRARAEDGRVDVAVGGERQVSTFAVAGLEGSEPALVFSATDVQEPGDLYRAAGGRETRLTRLDGEMLAGLSLPHTERRTFVAPDGTLLDGWLTHPLGRTRPAPLLVDIHGGPHSFFGPAFPVTTFYRYVMACRGWAVLALNPHGSGSYGRDFAWRIRGRWGELDFAEHMAAVDTLVAEGVADPRRLAVSGYSYGGFMVCWMATRTHRFRAAVAGGSLTDLESFFATSDIGLWFGSWEMGIDLESFFEHRELFRGLSPLHRVREVRTPLLLMHGEADQRCPVAQSEMFFAGLRTAGLARTRLVRYPGQSHFFHRIGRPSHRVDYVRRLCAWVEEGVSHPVGEPCAFSC